MLTPHDPRDLARRVAELERRLSNVLRYGTIHDVEGWRVRVAWGVQSDGEPALSAWVPWLTMRAGAALTWSPPSIGERCLLLSPEGDMRMGVAALALYSVPPHDPPPPEHEGGSGGITFAGDVIVAGALKVAGGVTATGPVTGASVRATWGQLGPVDLGSHVHPPLGGPPLPSGASLVSMPTPDEPGRIRLPSGDEATFDVDGVITLPASLGGGTLGRDGLRPSSSGDGGSDPPGDDPGEGGA